jgi:hypothetical protein
MSDAIFVRNDLIYDENNNSLFMNVNDEYELVKLNTDIYNENAKYNFNADMFDIPFFSPSDTFIN